MSLRILVVDPDPATRRAVREAAPGLEVIEAESAEQAIAVHAARAVDLAVVGGGLEGLGAPELVTILKGRSKGVLPIIVAGKGNFADVDGFLDSVEDAVTEARQRGPGSVVLFHSVAALG